MEMAWVHGVRMNDATAARIALAARESDVALTAHAPYYVNLCGTAEIVARSRTRLLEACRLAALCGASSVCFHAGAYGAHTPAAAGRMIRRSLAAVRRTLASEGCVVQLRPELTGRASQPGTLDEVLDWCEEVEGLLPCIDFAHHYARGAGRDNGYDGYRVLLETVRSRLGDSALRPLHVHLSGIEYGPSGERRHLPLRGSRFRYREVLRALNDAGVSGWVVCESPAREDDALHLQRVYRRLA
jgi:deoxyribonuclease-4